ncbi:MAG: HEPN domain protein [Candidatus Methanolliviera sp. GoM_oil]|nr:MAG: HEPN domain protein [Candidatus Methanolliviera sp. GoM_oil]
MRILDQYYIPTRYPNGFDVGAPMDYYTEKQAKGAIEYAEDLIEFVKREVE